MLPDVDSKPSPSSQSFVFPSVAITVTQKLLFPPHPIVFRQYAMPWAMVPETAINENSNPRSAEDNVRTPRQRCVVKPVPHATAVQITAETQFRAGVLGGHGLHAATDGVVERRRPTIKGIIVLLASAFHK